MKIAITLLAVLACFKAGEAIKCYQCASTTASCNDAYGKPAGDLKDCGSGVTGCSKLKVDTAGVVVTTRTCAASGSKDDKCDENTLLTVTTTSCTCQGEGCNSAFNVKTSVAFVTALVFVAKIFI